MPTTPAKTVDTRAIMARAEQFYEALANGGFTRETITDLATAIRDDRRLADLTPATKLPVIKAAVYLMNADAARFAKDLAAAQAAARVAEEQAVPPAKKEEIAAWKHFDETPIKPLKKDEAPTAEAAPEPPASEE